jgi:nucleoid-associated protein YgaU
LKSVDINYTTFDADGSPLHAELAAQFLEDLAPKKKSALDNLLSPDLTHRRLVKAGDTLPLLCRDIYGTPEHYLRVAEANGLDDFRHLIPGQELLFPPYAKSGG